MENYDCYTREELISELNSYKAALDNQAANAAHAPNYQAPARAATDGEGVSRINLQRDMLKTVMDSGTSTFWEYDAELDTIDLGVGYIDEPSQNEALPKYKQTPLVNMESFVATLHPDDKERVLEQTIFPILRGEMEKGTVTFRRLFGDKVSWLVSSLRISERKADGSTRRLVCYSQDITTQIEQSQRLQQVESENKLFEYAINFSNDEIHALDANGRFVFMNRLMMNNFGFKPPISNYKLTDIDDAYPIDRWKNETVPGVREGRITHFDAKHDYPDGSVRRIEVQLYKIDDPKHGEIFWAFCRDIDERLRQHQHITRLNTMMNAILDNSPIAFIAQDINNEMRYLYFNKTAERIVGFNARDILGHTDEEAFADYPKALALMKFYQQRVLAQKHVANYGVELPSLGGVKMNIINEIHQHVEIPADGVSLLLYLFWDVTEQHQKELELIRAKEADKLKSAFLANMSHEIRTPLNSIVGFSDLLAESEDADEKEMFREIIHKNNDLLLQLISDILDFSKIESGQLQFNLQPVNVKDVCFEVFQNFSLKKKEGVELIFDHDGPAAAQVVADYNRLSQVVINLVSNALKFTDQGHVRISYQTTATHVTISVEDTGMGIPADKQASLFNRFVKLNDFKQGTGLGLAISKMIVETLKGEVGFTSEEGNGATFWVRLPLIRR